MSTERIGEPMPVRKYKPQPETCRHIQCGRFAKSGQLCGPHSRRMYAGASIAPTIKKAPRPALSSQVLLEELAAGLSMWDIARAYGVQVESIQRTLARHQRSARSRTEEDQ